MPNETKTRVIDKRIKVRSKITLHGIIREGESKLEARARILFEAEQRINQKMDIRAHMSG